MLYKYALGLKSSEPCGNSITYLIYNFVPQISLLGCLGALHATKKGMIFR